MGISALIVEKGRSDLSFGTKEQKLGLRADPTRELVFKDCRLPKDNVLGQEGEAVKVFQAYGSVHLLGQASISAGIAQAVSENTIRYVKERTTAGPNTLASIENVQRNVADMAATTEVIKLLAYRAALVDPRQGPDPGMFVGAILGPEEAVRIAGKGIELHGGYGCTRDFPMERYFRDAKTLALQPTPDYVRINLGKMLLGVPMGAPPKGSGPPK